MALYRCMASICASLTDELVQVNLQLPVTKTGICNAIAFWFELDLDEETQLSTSPYCQKVLSSNVSWLQLNAFLCSFLHVR